MGLFYTSKEPSHQLNWAQLVLRVFGSSVLPISDLAYRRYILMLNPSICHANRGSEVGQRANVYTAETSAGESLI